LDGLLVFAKRILILMSQKANTHLLTPHFCASGEIGEKMFCSPRTVESYRDSLFKKLDLKSRVGLAVYAIKNGYSN
jgi:Bacterial regulatory proteins, luxR family